MCISILRLVASSLLYSTTYYTIKFDGSTIERIRLCLNGTRSNGGGYFNSDAWLALENSRYRAIVPLV